MTYELLQRMLYVDFGGSRPAGSDVAKAKVDVARVNPDHIGGYQAALPMLNGIETKFGLSLPRFGAPAAVKRQAS